MTWTGIDNIFNETLFLLSKSAIPNDGADDPDSRKLDSNQLEAVLMSLHEIVRMMAGGDENLTKFFELESRPSFGHLVSLMLSLFGDESQSLTIRLKAADVLRLLMKAEAVDSLAVVLPGFFLKLHTIALKSVNAAVSYNVCKSAVELICQLLCLTLSPPENASLPEAPNVRLNLPPSLFVQRDEKWLKMAAGNLEPQVFVLVSRLCTNANPNIRRAIFNLLKELASCECRKSFSSKLTVEALVDLCVVMRSDSDELIRSDVRSLAARLQVGENSDAIFRYLLKKLMDFLKNFSRIFHDSSRGFDVFQNLINCVEILDTESLERLATSSAEFRTKLLTEILASIRIDMPRVLISSASSPSSVTPADVGDKPARGKREFIQFFNEFPLRNGLLPAQLWELAQVIAASTQLMDMVSSELLDKFGTFSMDDRLAAVILLTTLCAVMPPGFVKRDESTALLESFTGFALNAIADLEHRLVDDVDDRQIESFHASANHSPASLLLSSLLYAICVSVSQLSSSALLNRPNLNALQVNVIYELLKWLSSPNSLIRLSAQRSIERLAEDDSIDAFLCRHTAAIVFKATLESRDSTRSWRCMPLVLAELLERTDGIQPSCLRSLDAAAAKPSELFEATRNIVEEMLRALDRSNQRKATLLLRAIRSYVRVVCHWYPDLKPSPRQELHTLAPESDDENNGEDDAARIYQEMEHRRVPSSAGCAPVRSVVSVLNRTKHMISSRHLPIQLLVLSILDLSLDFVRNFEDELLPMIHQNWQGLVQKFDGLSGSSSDSDERKIVAIEAIRVVSTMCRVSKGFVYQKVTNELSPRLCGFMHGAAAVFNNCSKSTLNSYHQMTIYRLQLAVIRSIPSIVCDCDLSEQDAEKFLAVLRVYAALPQNAEAAKAQGIVELRNAAKLSIDQIIQTREKSE